MRIFIIISLILNVILLISYILLGFISLHFIKKTVVYTTDNVSFVNSEHEFYPKCIKIKKFSSVLLHILAIYGTFTLIIAILYLGYIS